jgi:hypothetical protein
MRRTGTDLAVEREVEDDLGVRRWYRLVARFEPDTGGSPPGPEETARLLAQLASELDAALVAGPIRGATPRVDRATAELVEAYHPRQVELVDLLLAEGEITRGEWTRLRDHLAAGGGPPSALPEPAGIPATDRPLAAAPLAQDRTSGSVRPVDELVRLYRIESLKQAGAVRGRRQISYEEYMALKRHFASAEAAAAGGTPSPSE